MSGTTVSPPVELSDPAMTTAASLGSAAEWFTVVAAIGAIVISMRAFSIAARSERRQQFMRLHEIMIGPESQKGRRLLHTHATSAARISRLRRWHPSDFDLMNRAVSLHHTLAIYTRRRYIPLDAALDQWAATFRHSWPRIQTFILWRQEQYRDAALWDDMIWFADECGVTVDPALRRPSGDR